MARRFLSFYCLYYSIFSLLLYIFTALLNESNFVDGSDSFATHVEENLLLGSDCKASSAGVDCRHGNDGDLDTLWRPLRTPSSWEGNWGKSRNINVVQVWFGKPPRRYSMRIKSTPRSPWTSIGAVFDSVNTTDTHHFWIIPEISAAGLTLVVDRPWRSVIEVAEISVGFAASAGSPRLPLREPRASFEGPVLDMIRNEQLLSSDSIGQKTSSSLDRGRLSNVASDRKVSAGQGRPKLDLGPKVENVQVETSYASSQKEDEPLETAEIVSEEKETVDHEKEKEEEADHFASQSTVESDAVSDDDREGEEEEEEPSLNDPFSDIEKFFEFVRDDSLYQSSDTESELIIPRFHFGGGQKAAASASSSSSSSAQQRVSFSDLSETEQSAWWARGGISAYEAAQANRHLDLKELSFLASDSADGGNRHAESSSAADNEPVNPSAAAARAAAKLLRLATGAAAAVVTGGNKNRPSSGGGGGGGGGGDDKPSFSKLCHSVDMFAGSEQQQSKHQSQFNDVLLTEVNPFDRCLTCDDIDSLEEQLTVAQGRYKRAVFGSILKEPVIFATWYTGSESSGGRRLLEKALNLASISRRADDRELAIRASYTAFFVRERERLLRFDTQFVPVLYGGCWDLDHFDKMGNLVEPLRPMLAVISDPQLSLVQRLRVAELSLRLVTEFWSHMPVYDSEILKPDESAHHHHHSDLDLSLKKRPVIFGNFLATQFGVTADWRVKVLDVDIPIAYEPKTRYGDHVTCSSDLDCEQFYFGAAADELYAEEDEPGQPTAKEPSHRSKRKSSKLHVNDYDAKKASGGKQSNHHPPAPAKTGKLVMRALAHNRLPPKEFGCDQKRRKCRGLTNEQTNLFALCDTVLQPLLLNFGVDAVKDGDASFRQKASEIRQIIIDCLDADPAKRPSAATLRFRLGALRKHLSAKVKPAAHQLRTETAIINGQNHHQQQQHHHHHHHHGKENDNVSSSPFFDTQSSVYNYEFVHHSINSLVQRKSKEHEKNRHTLAPTAAPDFSLEAHLDENGQVVWSADPKTK